MKFSFKSVIVYMYIIYLYITAGHLKKYTKLISTVS